MATRSTTPVRTTISSSTQTVPGPFSATPALTTTFTPPPECTKGHLTMLQSAQYRIWMNEPWPVPNTTFSSCYPSEFMTSFLRSVSNTLVPAFSPLVCPDNYFTIFSQPMPSRPLYIACCPSNYSFARPEKPTPDRPAYGGTCYSDISKTLVTKYDNSSSSGPMFFSTSGQAYAHPLDGFALQTTSTYPGKLSTQLTANRAASAAASTLGAPSAANTSTDNSNPGMIAGLAVGLSLGAGLVLAAAFFVLRSRKRKQKEASRSGDHLMFPDGSTWPSKTVLELPSSPIEKVPPPVMRMGSELSARSGTALQEAPTYHEISSELPGEEMEASR